MKKYRQSVGRVTAPDFYGKGTDASEIEEDKYQMYLRAVVEDIENIDGVSNVTPADTEITFNAPKNIDIDELNAKLELFFKDENISSYVRPMGRPEVI